ncbi:hypothetical protein SAMN05216464_110139 [Mucilaginibacter pineti]|uniref:Uncharacterized protein n=1 Tax=Mucilaginibacter pineti TaxID=1391627 RepID=A0A1G7GGZ9_9SPHI|nr:hypothetical protein [Mucilaginibacter pineti]SDE87371.1 hypothetical protein SAMN05216464_110139 [Mucilaginibacter pineti]
MLLLVGTSMANGQTNVYKEHSYRKIFKLKYPQEYIVEELSYPLKDQYSQSWIYKYKQRESMTVRFTEGFEIKPAEEYFEKEAADEQGYAKQLVPAKPYKTTQPTSLNWYYRKYCTKTPGLPLDTLDEYTFLDDKASTSITFTFQRIPQKEIDYLVSQVRYTKPKWEASDYVYLFIGISIFIVYLLIKFRRKKAL